MRVFNSRILSFIKDVLNSYYGTASSLVKKMKATLFPTAGLTFLFWNVHRLFLFLLINYEKFLKRKEREEVISSTAR